MTREQVLEIMPEINLIHSQELREKSIRCWQDVIEMGGWEEKGIENAPLGVGYVSDDCPERGIDHCRRVVRCCKVMYDELHEYAKCRQSSGLRSADDRRSTSRHWQVCLLRQG